MGKYGGLAKLYFEELEVDKLIEERIKVEYHAFPEKTFCSGATFVSKVERIEEDDGWIVTFVHNENSNISQVNLQVMLINFIYCFCFFISKRNFIYCVLICLFILGCFISDLYN